MGYGEFRAVSVYGIVDYDRRVDLDSVYDAGLSIFAIEVYKFTAMGLVYGTLGLGENDKKKVDVFAALHHFDPPTMHVCIEGDFEFE